MNMDVSMSMSMERDVMSACDCARVQAIDAVPSSEAKHAAPLTAEEQRAQRKARMAARQRERQERLKELEAAERRAATARQFYEELKAVVKEQNDH